MDRKFWDTVAPLHEDEIFDVRANDTKKIIESNIIKYTAPGKSVIDIGCAVGKWLPLLSPHFKKVIAVDISSKYVEIAREKNKSLPNVQYMQADLSNPKNKMPACEAAVCINTLLTPDIKKINIAFTSLRKIVKMNGHLILVVPSLESALLIDHVLAYWNKKDGSPQRKVSKKENPFQGIVERDDNPTKHFLREELFFTLQQHGFAIKEVEKIEYPWKTEFNNPPKWLGAPYPWDWMVVAQRVKSK